MVKTITEEAMTNIGVEVVRFGDKHEPDSIRWYLDGVLHRLDGPAVEFSSGEKLWVKHGDRHREGGPAHTDMLCHAWFKNNLRHREDGPAIEWHDGGRDWYINGKRHREDGPADIGKTYYEWYINDNHIPDNWIIENIIDSNNITRDERILMRLTWM